MLVAAETVYCLLSTCNNSGCFSKNEKKQDNSEKKEDNIKNPSNNEDKKNSNTSNTPSYYLYLNKVDNNNRVKTVKTVHDQLKIGLKEAKDIVLAVENGGKMMIMQSFDYSTITSVCESLKAEGCTCEITSN